MALKINQKQNKKGFTMVEIMVVVIIIAILTGVGVGGFTRSRQRQVLIQKGVFIEGMLKNARNASIIGLRGMDTQTEVVPPGFGVNINLADDADDVDVITYFTDRTQDYAYDADAASDDESVETITLEDFVTITELRSSGAALAVDEVNIVFVPPRGLSLITYGDPADPTIVEDFEIVLGVNGEKDTDTNHAIPIHITTGGGKIDLIIY